MRHALAAALLAVVGATSATAHWEDPAAIVAELNAGRTPAAAGVVRAERDAHAPRLLVVRVGPGWYALPAEVRREHAASWHTRWRHAVPQGVVAVLDTGSAAPVVTFGPGGTVRTVAGAPPPAP